MPSDIILRGEDALPDHLAALLQEPPSDGIWHLPGRPPPPDPGFMQRVMRALRAVVGRRPETASDEPAQGERRFGLWLTGEHLLLADGHRPRAVRRADIVGVLTRHSSRRNRDLLVFELEEGQLDIPIDWLDGWEGRHEALKGEVERRLTMPSVRTDALEIFAANREFDGFVRWLDTEVRRLQPDADGRAQLLELTAVALSTWPDDARRAPAELFLAGERDGDGRPGFARDDASALLPLCRTATFDAARHLPDATAVADCAMTFRDVPLSGIEIDGKLGDRAFEAFLIWAGTKPLTALAMDGANERQRARLAEFKREHGLA